MGTSLQNASSRLRRSEKDLQATDEKRIQREIELHSLEKENKGIGNNSGTEQAMKIDKVFKSCC